MNIEQDLKKILSLYRQSRGRGYTTILQRLEDKNQIKILVGFEKDKRPFKDAKSVYGKNLKGIRQDKPLIMDNKLILEVLQGSLSKIEAQREIVRNQNKNRDHLQRTINRRNAEVERLEGIIEGRLLHMEVVKFAKSIRWNLKKLFIPTLVLYEKFKLTIGK